MLSRSTSRHRSRFSSWKENGILRLQHLPSKTPNAFFDLNQLDLYLCFGDVRISLDSTLITSYRRFEKMKTD